MVNGSSEKLQKEFQIIPSEEDNDDDVLLVSTKQKTEKNIKQFNHCYRNQSLVKPVDPMFSSITSKKKRKRDGTTLITSFPYELELEIPLAKKINIRSFLGSYYEKIN